MSSTAIIVCGPAAAVGEIYLQLPRLGMDPTAVVLEFGLQGTRAVFNCRNTDDLEAVTFFSYTAVWDEAAFNTLYDGVSGDFDSCYIVLCHAPHCRDADFHARDGLDAITHALVRAHGENVVVLAYDTLAFDFEGDVSVLLCPDSGVFDGSTILAELNLAPFAVQAAPVVDRTEDEALALLEAALRADFVVLPQGVGVYRDSPVPMIEAADLVTPFYDNNRLSHFEEDVESERVLLTPRTLSPCSEAQSDGDDMSGPE